MSSVGLGAGLLFTRSPLPAFFPSSFSSRSAEGNLVRTPLQGQLGAGPFPMPPSLPASVAALKSFRFGVTISGGGAVRPRFLSGAVARRPSEFIAYFALAGRANFSSEPWVWTGPPAASRVRPSAQGAYEQYQPNGAAEHPRPPMIPWERDLANAVQLIGTVGRSIDLKYLSSGKVIAKTSLGVKTGSSKDDTSWFELEIWDALAEVAAQHVQKGERIFVFGKILVEKWVKDDVRNSISKVVVRDFCFVEPYGKTYGQEESLYSPTLDNRIPVTSSVDASQRSSNQQRPTNPPPGTAPSKNNDAALATEKRWQEYFADPSQWWDNRHNKKNPKSPDFKHKSTQEALWLESWSNPPWVSEQMAVLEKQVQHGGNFADRRQQARNKNLSSFTDSDFMY